MIIPVSLRQMVKDGSLKKKMLLQVLRSSIQKKIISGRFLLALNLRKKELVKFCMILCWAGTLKGKQIRYGSQQHRVHGPKNFTARQDGWKLQGWHQEK